jgi:YVTN family beta-propeller protein
LNRSDTLVSTAKRALLAPALIFIVIYSLAQPDLKKTLVKSRVLLPNGWSLTPAGTGLPLGDLPLNIASSASKKYIAVINNGESAHSLQLFDASNNKCLDSTDINRSFVGLKFSADEKYVYVSGGNDNQIIKYAITGNKLVLADYIKLGEQWNNDELTEIFVRKKLYWIFWNCLLVAVVLSSLVFFFLRAKKLRSKWSIIILVIGILLLLMLASALVVSWNHRMLSHKPTKISIAGLDVDDARHLLYTVTKENNSLYVIDLETKRIQNVYQLPGEGYTCLLSADKKELYISCWGCNRILVFDTKQKKMVAEIPVGDHPNDICLTKDNRYCFVANANDNSISVIDISKRAVIETLNAALYPNAPQGSTTNAVALSEDDKTLYAANADNNCLAVFDISAPGNSISKGFIPVGWYPTAVKVIGKKIFVANGKGFSSLADLHGPNPAATTADESPKTKEYIASLFRGTLSVINEPTPQELGTYAELVYENTPYSKTKEYQADGEPGNPIPMHVGDTSPIKYVFYVIKENRTYDQVLGDLPQGNGDPDLVLFGGQITPNQHALAKEFVLLDNFYCDAEVSADGHNWSMGAYANDFLEKTWPSSYGGKGGNYDGEGRRPIANNKNGFIWSYCKRAGVSYRSYGEFIDDNKPNIAVLKNHYCPTFRGWDLSVRDTTRVGQWKKDFDSLLKRGSVPQLSTIYLGNDHTEGMKNDRPTPFAYVADNDLAVGELVEYLSQSPIWKQCAVFVLEDDAQDGPDHVDAHRSTVYLSGGLVKRHLVDHTLYSTSSVLRTIELILGLPPMSQYDAAAIPLWRCFAKTADSTRFNSVRSNVDLNEKNSASGELAKKSASFNFTREDLVPEAQFNEVLWKSIKGIRAIMPPPRRAAFVRSGMTRDDD